MSIHRSRALALISTSLTVALASAGTAWADCVPDATGTTVSCTGSSTGFSTSNPNAAITVTSGTTITGTGLQAVGVSSSVDNSGTINTGAGTTAISLGGAGAVTQESAATGPITGNILFGAASGAQVNTLTNLSTTNGIVGSITSVGNTLINNSGPITGNIAETTASGADAVTINNLTGATITGSVTTADSTSITNNGTITGTVSATAPLTLVNAGTLTGSIIQTTPFATAGNMSVSNSGTITGNISETAGGTPGLVSINNAAGATLTGNITTADALNFSNAGTYSGSITTPGVATSTVNNSGTMTLAGTLTGNVINSGTFSTGATPTAAAPALLTINGNYTQTGGTLNAALASSTLFGQIHATGTAALAGTINVVPAQGFYPSGSTYNIVLADQGVIDNGVTVTGTTAVSPFLTFTSNGIVSTGSAASPNQQAYQIAATRAPSYANILAPTATLNQLAVAAGFQNLVNTANAAPTSDAAALVGGVDFMTIAQAQTFFDQVSPQGYGAYVTALQDQGNLFSRQINLRLDTIAITKDVAGLWLTPYYQRGMAGGATYGSGENITGIAGGYDAARQSWRAGLSAGYSNASVDYNIGNLSGTNSNLQLSAYGGLTFGHLSADLQLDYTSGSLKSVKTITLGTLTRTADATSKGHLLKAVGNIGYDIGGDADQIRPFVGFDLSKGSIAGFTETGATSANLTVSSLSADRSDVLVGVDYARKVGAIQPYVHVAYRRTLTTPGTLVTGLFNADPTTSFAVTDVAPSRSEEDVNLGIRSQVHDDGSQVFIGYQGAFRSGLTSHGINAGLLVTF